MLVCSHLRPTSPALRNVCCAAEHPSSQRKPSSFLPAAKHLPSALLAPLVGTRHHNHQRPARTSPPAPSGTSASRAHRYGSTPSASLASHCSPIARGLTAVRGPSAKSGRCFTTPSSKRFKLGTVRHARARSLSTVRSGTRRYCTFRRRLPDTFLVK